MSASQDLHRNLVLNFKSEMARDADHCVSTHRLHRQHYERVTSTPSPCANKAVHSGFETQRRRHQKSKTGVSVAPQKGLVSSKNFISKKKQLRCHNDTPKQMASVQVLSYEFCLVLPAAEPVDPLSPVISPDPTRK